MGSDERDQVTSRMIWYGGLGGGRQSAMLGLGYFELSQLETLRERGGGETG